MSLPKCRAASTSKCGSSSCTSTGEFPASRRRLATSWPPPDDRARHCCQADPAMVTTPGLLPPEPGSPAASPSPRDRPPFYSFRHARICRSGNQPRSRRFSKAGRQSVAIVLRRGPVPNCAWGSRSRARNAGGRPAISGRGNILHGFVLVDRVGPDPDVGFLARLNGHPDGLVLLGHYRRQLVLRVLHGVVGSTPARIERWLTTILPR